MSLYITSTILSYTFFSTKTKSFTQSPASAPIKSPRRRRFRRKPTGQRTRHSLGREESSQPLRGVQQTRAAGSRVSVIEEVVEVTRYDPQDAQIRDTAVR